MRCGEVAKRRIHESPARSAEARPDGRAFKSGTLLKANKYKKIASPADGEAVFVI